jgi:hypothetical protein
MQRSAAPIRQAARLLARGMPGENDSGLAAQVPATGCAGDNSYGGAYETAVETDSLRWSRTQHYWFRRPR